MLLCHAGRRCLIHNDLPRARVHSGQLLDAAEQLAAVLLLRVTRRVIDLAALVLEQYAHQSPVEIIEVVVHVQLVRAEEHARRLGTVLLGAHDILFDDVITTLVDERLLCIESQRARGLERVLVQAWKEHAPRLWPRFCHLRHQRREVGIYCCIGEPTAALGTFHVEGALDVILVHGGNAVLPVE